MDEYVPVIIVLKLKYFTAILPLHQQATID